MRPPLPAKRILGIGSIKWLEQTPRRVHPVRVRVISYTIEDGREPAGPYRLITTLINHRKAPAAELAAAYAQRWELESAFDELK